MRKNQGSPGIDGLTVDELPDYLRTHWPGLREQMLAGTYQLAAVKAQLIPKGGGEMRKLGIPTVLDRFIQQALLQVHVLMGRLANRIDDRRCLRLIRRYLEAGILVEGLAMERNEGTPQGGPSSPLLANVLLDEVDKELETRARLRALRRRLQCVCAVSASR